MVTVLYYDITLHLASTKVTMLTLSYNFKPCQGKGNYANIMIYLYTLPRNR